MSNPLIRYWKLHKIPILLALLSCIFYYVFAYQLIRTDFVKLITLFAALFFICLRLVRFEKWNLRFLAVCGVIFRLIFLMSEPNLSQDYFRFIWDGHLVSQFQNPYLLSPDVLIEQSSKLIPNAELLHQNMGDLSAKHYSNYPPVNQLFFALAAFFGGQSIFNSILFMRLSIILADLGILYFGRKLLKNLNQSPHLIFWYFLNPLVIIELTGNLHFEGVMLFFFVWALYLISIKKWMVAALPYAFSICVKLVPLLFLPLFLKYFGIKKSALFYTLIVMICILLFIPFYSSEFISNYSETVGLWFSNFEFNAGIYNLVKYTAVQLDAKPWELIKTYGTITQVLTVLVILALTFLRKNEKLPVLAGSMLWALSFYYFITPTVHPWYIIFPVLLCLFTEYRFPIIWSAAATLSYFAYSMADFQENMWLLTLEYFCVFGFMLYEIVKLGKLKLIFRNN
ncbi:mannosyltransferase [Cytophaga sp. FL35]|uniref:mannosyltransferase n=1 Tax=Cytophaga sp. FL35 TaxID=1904456 RepID=UPI001653A7DE|nr:mannosyltransferase [Cytophaga sp. FL35]MBC6998994.1 mannosyltransferase [Cytophaga sp. FL35]